MKNAILNENFAKFMASQSVLQCSALPLPARHVNDEKLSRGGVTEQLPTQNP